MGWVGGGKLRLGCGFLWVSKGFPWAWCEFGGGEGGGIKGVVRGLGVWHGQVGSEGE